MGVLNRRTAAIIIALTVLCVLRSNGHTGPFDRPTSVKARHQLKLGNKMLKLQNYDLAIQAYKRGYVIEAKTIFVHNLALAHRLKGEYKKSIEYYETFLRDAKPSAEVRTGMRKLIKKMKDELAKAARTTPPVEPEPRKSKSKTLTIKPPPPRPRPAPWHADTAAWGITSAGVVLGGVGIGLLANAAGLRSDADNEPSGAIRDELNSKANSRETFGVVVGIVGLAALAGGIVKLVLHDKASVVVSPTSISLAGRF